MTAETQIAAEAALDHARAVVRGRRVRALCDYIIAELHAEGIATFNRDDARVVLFHVIADFLYGNAAIDIPPLRTEDR